MAELSPWVNVQGVRPKKGFNSQHRKVAVGLLQKEPLPDVALRGSPDAPGGQRARPRDGDADLSRDRVRRHVAVDIDVPLDHTKSDAAQTLQYLPENRLGL